jgi:hypothetical protein
MTVTTGGEDVSVNIPFCFAVENRTWGPKNKREEKAVITYGTLPPGVIQKIVFGEKQDLRSKE